MESVTTDTAVLLLQSSSNNNNNSNLEDNTSYYYNDDDDDHGGTSKKHEMKIFTSNATLHNSTPSPDFSDDFTGNHVFSTFSSSLSCHQMSDGNSTCLATAITIITTSTTTSTTSASDINNITTVSGSGGGGAPARNMVAIKNVNYSHHQHPYPHHHPKRGKNMLYRKKDDSIHNNNNSSNSPSSKNCNPNTIYNNNLFLSSTVPTDEDLSSRQQQSRQHRKNQISHENSIDLGGTTTTRTNTTSSDNSKSRLLSTNNNNFSLQPQDISNTNKESQLKSNGQSSGVGNTNNNYYRNQISPSEATDKKDVKASTQSQNNLLLLPPMIIANKQHNVTGGAKQLTPPPNYAAIKTPLMITKSNDSGYGGHGNSPSEKCAGCKFLIHDKYLLKAEGKFWHEDCLRCSCCECRLGEVGSTFFLKANLFLCKRDYLRLFGNTGSCTACERVIPAFEMVMRARGNVYHLECFACQECNHRFCVGDKFYLWQNRILCERDYEDISAAFYQHYNHQLQLQHAQQQQQQTRRQYQDNNNNCFNRVTPPPPPFLRYRSNDENSISASDDNRRQDMDNRFQYESFPNQSQKPPNSLKEHGGLNGRNLAFESSLLQIGSINNNGYNQSSMSFGGSYSNSHKGYLNQDSSFEIDAYPVTKRKYDVAAMSETTCDTNQNGSAAEGYRYLKYSSQTPPSDYKNSKTEPTFNRTLDDMQQQQRSYVRDAPTRKFVTKTKNNLNKLKGDISLTNYPYSAQGLTGDDTGTVNNNNNGCVDLPQNYFLNNNNNYYSNNTDNNNLNLNKNSNGTKINGVEIPTNSVIKKQSFYEKMEPLNDDYGQLSIDIPNSSPQPPVLPTSSSPSSNIISGVTKNFGDFKTTSNFLNTQSIPPTFEII